MADSPQIPRGYIPEVDALKEPMSCGHSKACLKTIRVSDGYGDFDESVCTACVQQEKAVRLAVEAVQMACSFCGNTHGTRCPYDDDGTLADKLRLERAVEIADLKRQLAEREALETCPECSEKHVSEIHPALEVVLEEGKRLRSAEIHNEIADAGFEWKPFQIFEAALDAYVQEKVGRRDDEWIAAFGAQDLVPKVTPKKLAEWVFRDVEQQLERLQSELNQTEFCKSCGAGIGTHRRTGEGTCPQCENL